MWIENIVYRYKILYIDRKYYYKNEIYNHTVSKLNDIFLLEEYEECK
jgi:hypothetical protein